MSKRERSPAAAKVSSSLQMPIWRKVLLLIEPGTRLRWILLAGLAIVVAGVELLGALLIFSLLQIPSGESDLSLPVIGDLQSYFPEASQQRMLAWLLGAAVIFFLFHPLLALAQIYLQRRTEQLTGARISERLVRGYLEMPDVDHLRRNSAELIRNSFLSVSQVVSHFLSPLARMLSEVLVVLGLTLALGWSSPVATFLALATLAPIVFVVLRVVHPRFQQ